MTMISLERLDGNIPQAFPDLEADAKAGGHAHMTRLAAEFTGDRAMFHAIFACHSEGRLVGIGAITDEPTPTLLPMWRMRRLYVHQHYRRRGIAQAIADALLLEAAGKVSIVSVHAGNDGAARFWETIGFGRVENRPWSHEAGVSQLLSARSIG
ncbi:GNAT family N-acetyltransferase [Bradyrhizobium stylosanthis]|uniref:GNAT family N-acetyltransferase n=1 Tax=Bradyrhizobium stylosanthis TaxID=1803665 RepID=UPI0007C55B60|nr:GNAT family N-acetyltransferase [Bradyrhizobium stylosanthis]